MRAREFVSEIIRGRPLVNPDVPDDKLPSNIKLTPFPGYKELGYIMGRVKGKSLWSTESHESLRLYDLRTRMAVAELTWLPRKSMFPNAIESSRVFVKNAYKGRGIAAAMYRFLAVVKNKIIIADDSQPEGWGDDEVGQTPDARRLWIKMAESVPDITVKGWVEINPNNLFNDEEDEIVENIMKLGGQWLKHKGDNWIVAFDVVANPNRTELQAYIRTFLNKEIYVGRNSYGPEYDQGLLLMSVREFQRLTGYAP